jgi:hypothetical protein
MFVFWKKVRKIPARIWTAPNVFLKPIALKKHQDASSWMQHSHKHLFNLENKLENFSYTIFPVKKINIGKFLKLWEKLFNYSLYSHPEIGNFRVWQVPLHPHLRAWASRRSTSPNALVARLELVADFPAILPWSRLVLATWWLFVA